MSWRRLFTPLERRCQLHHERTSHQKNAALQHFSDCCCWHISALFMCVTAANCCARFPVIFLDSGRLTVGMLTSTKSVSMFYSINNSHSFLFTFSVREPAVSSTTTGYVRVLPLQMVNIIGDIVENAEFCLSWFVILNCSSTCWLAAFSSSSSEKMEAPLFHSQHPSQEAPGREDGCSALVMSPLRAANWKPCVVHKSVTQSAEIYKDRRIRGHQLASRDALSSNSLVWIAVWINLSMRMSMIYIVPTLLYTSWSTSWGCLSGRNLFLMPDAACEAVVFSCEHLRENRVSGLSSASAGGGGHVTDPGAGAASGHLWWVLEGWADLVYHTTTHLPRSPSSPPNTRLHSSLIYLHIYIYI